MTSRLVWSLGSGSGAARTARIVRPPKTYIGIDASQSRRMSSLEGIVLASAAPSPALILRWNRITPRMPSHDVLIIGAGLAGQRAALAAAEAGASVAIMSKVHPVRSHSNAAAGGINAALNPEDSWESHAYDTVKGSDFLGDQDAIEIMCQI